MKQIELKNGFKVELADETMDNMELVDALAEASDSDPLAVSKICEMVLGDKNRKELYDSLRTEDGRVPVAAVSEAIKDIFQEFGDKGKNS